LDVGKHVTLLGTREGRAYFAIDLSHQDDPYQHPLLEAQGAFDDLRKFGPSIDQHEGAILAHARGLMFWHARHLHCGVCGSPTEASHAGNQRNCTNPDCKTQHFPRTDPAVIMLVYKGDYCLLGRNANFPIPGMYSTLAGFVEPGESLEEAVAREVLEEVGVTVLPEKVHYWASQPWPFPASLMLGFHAESEDMEIVLQEDEIEDAKWLHRLQMDDPESHGVKFPRRDSIAYRLINAWMQGDIKG
jgi:NAD+ diphosphatase